MKQFRVVRTFMGDSGRDKLQDAFDAGYVLVRASEFVPDTRRGNSTYLGYIEYILARENPEETYEAGYKTGFKEGREYGEEKGKTEGYFDGQAYGWEEGRKDLCDKISAEIKEIKYPEGIKSCLDAEYFVNEGLDRALAIIEKYMAESENHEEEEKRKIDFLEFLVNHINPNEMEKYRTMYESGGEKTDEA